MERAADLYQWLTLGWEIMTRDMSRDMLYRSLERRRHPLLGQA